MKKRRTQSLLFWSNLKKAEIEKNKQWWGKTSDIGLTKYVKIKSLSPLPLPGKTLFVQLGLDFQVWLLLLVPRLHF